MASKYAKDELTRYNNEEIRIVMVGKTGAGKSATGNIILGKKPFKSKFSSKSFTIDCAKADGEVKGQKVAVIDTPGLFDTSIKEEKTRGDISQCISFGSPGPHIFLVIIKLGRFTAEEKQTVQKIQEIFGEDADKYSMVLFTHGDLLKGQSIEEFLQESEELQELVARCNNQYHVFNNELEDRSQVSELLNKIRKITEKNGGSHYTSDMFQEAERILQEEKQRILKEKEEQKRKETEELEKKLQEKFDQKLKKVEGNIEKEREVMVAHKREMEENMNKLEVKYEEMARKEAERSESVLNKFASGFGDFCGGFCTVFAGPNIGSEIARKVSQGIRNLAK